MYVCEIEDFERDIGNIFTDEIILDVYVTSGDDYVVVIGNIFNPENRIFELNQVWRYNKGCTEGILVSECTDSGLIDIINRLNTESDV
jgi:hypothetical protein